MLTGRLALGRTALTHAPYRATLIRVLPLLLLLTERTLLEANCEPTGTDCIALLIAAYSRAAVAPAPHHYLSPATFPQLSFLNYLSQLPFAHCNRSLLAPSALFLSIVTAHAGSSFAVSFDIPHEFELMSCTCTFLRNFTAKIAVNR